MKLLRIPLLLGLVALAMLLLFGASFVPCLHVESDDCCQKDDDCNEPICDGGASCHCACAFSGMTLTVAYLPIVPTLIDRLSVESPVQPFFDLTCSLDRPPRFL